MIKAKNTHTHTPAICNQKSTSKDTDMLKKVLLKDLLGGKTDHWWRREKYATIHQRERTSSGKNIQVTSWKLRWKQLRKPHFTKQGQTQETDQEQVYN